MKKDKKIKQKRRLRRNLLKFPDGSIVYVETTTNMKVDVADEHLGEAEYQREANDDEVKLIRDNDIQKLKLKKDKLTEENVIIKDRIS